MSLRSSKNKKIEKRPAKSCEESIIAAYGGLFLSEKRREEIKNYHSRRKNSISRHGDS